MAKPYKRGDSPYWWISPTINGIQTPRSTRTTDYQEALDMIRRLEGKIADGEITNPETDRGSVGELLELVRSDYKRKKRRNLYSLEKIIDVQLKPKLGWISPPLNIEHQLDRYVDDRLADGVTGGTINNELRALHRAFVLGQKRRLVSQIPPIINELKFPSAPARDGYYRPDEFCQMLTLVVPLLRDILIVAYITGWRLRSILKLQWHQIDFKNGFVRQTESKNVKATRWPIDFKFEQLGGVSLRQAFEARKAETASIKDRIIPYVFHRNGRPVRSIRGAFHKALADVELDRVFHDFRGTAIVNLLEAGADTADIMNMVGLKTAAMVVHYSQLRGMRDDRLRETGKLLEMRLGTPKTGATTDASTT